MGIFRRGARKSKTPPRLDPKMKYPDYINPSQDVEPEPAEDDFFAKVEEDVDVPDSKPKTKPEKVGVISLSRGVAFLCGVGLVFLILWVFILGILVGRGSIFQNEAFQKMQEKLLDKNVDDFAQALEITEEKAIKAEGKGETELTFFEDLTKKRKDEERRRTAEKDEKESASSKKQEKPEKRNEKDKQEKQTPAAEKTVKPANDVKTVPNHASEAKPPERNPGENFTVQVAAARNLEGADKIVNKLKKDGFDAYYYQVVLQNRKYFRIRVGRFSNREDAQAAYKKLAEKGYKNMFVSSLLD